MKLIFVAFFLITSQGYSDDKTAYKFLKERSKETQKQFVFNQYEDILSGAMAFTVGNIGYFTTESSTLKIAYSGIQTVGIIAVGHGIYDYYYPHFEQRLLELLSKKNLSRGELAHGYVSLLGEMDRAKRLSLLWSSSLLTLQYGLNALLGQDIPTDMKDIYLFLGGVNAIIATYSFLNVSAYEEYFLNRSKIPKVGLFIFPDGSNLKTGVGLSYSW